MVDGSIRKAVSCVLQVVSLKTPQMLRRCQTAGEVLLIGISRSQGYRFGRVRADDSKGREDSLLNFAESGIWSKRVSKRGSVEGSRSELALA